jgi:anion-transporting  ArsA/GET3 family ATPase
MSRRGTSVSLQTLLQSHVVFVSGKGGTGKTTFAAAFAKHAAASGRSVCLMEVDSQRAALIDLFDVEPPYEPLEVAPGLSICNATWMECLVDWLKSVVPVDRLVRIILDNPMVRPFLEATPGAREVVILSRLVELSRRFELVVVDMPASGHARALLRIPLVALEVFRSGPVFERCSEVVALYQQPSTRLVLMSLPEEMVVTETIETARALRTEVPALVPSLIVLNRALTPVLTEHEQVLLVRLAAWSEAATGVSTEAADLVRAGRWEARRESGTAEALERMQKAGLPEVLLVPPHPVRDSPSGRLERTRAFIARAEVQARATGRAG